MVVDEGPMMARQGGRQNIGTPRVAERLEMKKISSRDCDRDRDLCAVMVMLLAASRRKTKTRSKWSCGRNLVVASMNQKHGSNAC